MRFILGAHGGAKGFNPFPAARAERFKRKWRFPQPAPAPTLDLNHSQQPWQKTADRLERRAEKRPHLDWNARRAAREERKAAAEAQRLADVSLLKAG